MTLLPIAFPRALPALLALSLALPAAAQDLVLAVETARLQKDADAPAEVYVGTVRASELLGLSYGARGCILTVSEEAKRAKVASEGQVLVELDDQRSQLALRTAEARLLDLEAALAERALAVDAARADDRRRAEEVEFVAKEYERNLTMFRRGLINETTMESVERRMMDANFTAERASEAVDNALSAMKRAEIALEIGRLDMQTAELNHEMLVLEAPIDGVLIEFDPKEGACVQEGELAGQIYEPHKKAVDVYVLVSDLSATDPTGIFIGAPVTVTRVNGEVCGGTVTRIETEAELESQYVNTTIELDEACAPDLFLNEAVEVVAAGQGGTATFTLPSTALQGETVFLVDESTGTLEAVEAEIVRRGMVDSILRMTGVDGRLYVTRAEAEMRAGQSVLAGQDGS